MDQQKQRSTFAVPKMDCPSEEIMVRMALQGAQGAQGVQSLAFDLGARKLTVAHTSPVSEVLGRLEPLGLGAQLVDSAPIAAAKARKNWAAACNRSEAAALACRLQPLPNARPKLVWPPGGNRWLPHDGDIRSREPLMHAPQSVLAPEHKEDFASAGAG
ncbi:hypothetical protein WG922_16010 [Ramlibacter sp. AN1015]|uniref:hypothetical protein n=1 Tax=Ramlibacter sp. AN1015 TaxID=3133428 RepID=UPI0030BB27D0